MPCKQGFTLVELMITVGIIGILATIAIPTFSQYMTTARRSEAFTMLDALEKGAVSYYHTEFVEQGLGAAELRQCVVELSGDFIPAVVLPPPAADIGKKKFADFSTNDSFNALGVTDAGMWYYVYKIGGSVADAGTCGVTEQSGMAVYQFDCGTALSTTSVENVGINVGIIGGEMIIQPGADIAVLNF